MKVRLEDITPETLDQIAAEWNEESIRNLFRDPLIRLGRELEFARAEANNAEVRAKIRALMLHREFNWDAAEIADMLGLTKREVNKWLSSK